MEFGKVAASGLADVDFTLPEDGPFVLSGNKAAAPRIFVGCAKWGRKEWRGLIYPPKAKEADFLDEYVKHFNAIELNAAFYQMPKLASILRWREKAEANATQDFLFCPKIPRLISHMKKLRNSEELTADFLSIMHEFGPYLGPCFLQLSDQFGPKSLDALEAYLPLFPVDMELFVEYRHPDFYADAGLRKAAFDLLARAGRGAAITDASGRRDVLHMNLITPAAFIRFVGNGAAHQDSDFQRIDAWVARLRSWLDQGLERVYFFLHQHDEKDTPVIAEYAIRQFNEQLNAGLQPIRFL